MPTTRRTPTPTLTPIVVALEVLLAPSVGCMKTFPDRPAAVGGGRCRVAGQVGQGLGQLRALQWVPEDRSQI